MTVLLTLWLPILLSAVFVFIVSSVIHMALPWHKSDFQKMPGDGAVLDLLSTSGVPAGDYMLPYMGPEEMKTPEGKARIKTGPMMIATVRTGGFNMGRSMTLWFLYCLAISYFAAYVEAHYVSAVAAPAAHARHVRLAFLTAFLGFSGALWQQWIWYGKSLVATIKSSIDSAVYAAVIACTLHWLWR